mgnify:CR=1 FL=1
MSMIIPNSDTWPGPRTILLIPSSASLEQASVVPQRPHKRQPRQSRDISLVRAESEETFPRRRSAETSIALDIEALMRDLVSKSVCLTNQADVREYLSEFPALIDVIPVAVDAAQAQLPEARLYLGVYFDPEIEDRYMVLNVRVKEYDESVVECIEAAEAKFIDLLVNKEGWLQLTTDFGQPEIDYGL